MDLRAGKRCQRILRASVAMLAASHDSMEVAVNRTRSLLVLPFFVLGSSSLAFAQEPEGPQASAPPPVAPAARPVVERRVGANDKVTVPAGTRVAVVLENGISTRSAKAGDSL